MSPEQISPYQHLPMFIFIFLAFYFIVLRPQQKKQKEHKQMIEGIKKNDEVVTVGGIHGTVVNVKEKTLVLRVDDTTKIEIDKSSLGYVARKKEKKEP